MKKALTLVLTLAMVLTLTACGNSAKPEKEPVSETTETVEAESESLSNLSSTKKKPKLEAIPQYTSDLRQPTLNVSVDDYFKQLDLWLAYRELPVIADDQYLSDGDEISDWVFYGGDLCAGLSISCNTPINHKDLSETTIMLDYDISDENSKTAFVDLCRATVYGIDNDIAETIEEKLNFSDFSDGQSNCYDSANAGYVYTVDANMIQLFVMAR